VGLDPTQVLMSPVDVGEFAAHADVVRDEMLEASAELQAIGPVLLGNVLLQLEVTALPADKAVSENARRKHVTNASANAIAVITTEGRLPGSLAELGLGVADRTVQLAADVELVKRDAVTAMDAADQAGAVDVCVDATEVGLRPGYGAAGVDAEVGALERLGTGMGRGGDGKDRDERGGGEEVQLHSSESCLPVLRPGSRNAEN